MNIGSVALKSNLLSAPMAGFSDAGLRHLCSLYGAGLTFTEMVSAKGMVYGNKGTEALLFTVPDQTPSAVQLFGSDPEFMFRAARDERLKGFDIIDINMGCPVRKVVQNGDGSALMKNPSLITELVTAAVEGGGKPVTVKLRAGIKQGIPLAVECAVAAQKGGAAAVTVHPRYAEQMYSGTADHAVTAEVKSALDVPVVANGDITDAESLASAAAVSGADAFMIGRAAVGRPYLFASLRGFKRIEEADLHNGLVTENGFDCYKFDVKDAIYDHMAILLEIMPERVAVNCMKQQLCRYALNIPASKAVRKAITGIASHDDFRALVEEFF